jgi:hypothetical protein
MDEVVEYLDFVYGESEGFVGSPTAINGEWTEYFFELPKDKAKLVEHIKENGQKGDVYITPALFRKRSTLNIGFRSCNVAWVDYDLDSTPIDLSSVPQPDLVVNSSESERAHLYWRIDTITKSSELGELNKRLAYSLNGDIGAWNSNRLLRPPGTRSFKRNSEVTIKERNYGNVKTLKDFARLPELKVETVEITESQLIDVQKVLDQLPIRASVRKRILEETPGVGSRSQFLYKVARELAELGATHAQIASVVKFVDDRVGKFSKRRDQMARISEMTSLVLAMESEQGELKLYSPTEVIETKKKLSWLFGRFLHTEGLMLITGSPGVGKTQFCSQLSYHFSTGMPFHDWPMATCRVLFMSLEMQHFEFTYIMQRQDKELTDREAWDNHTRLMDEETSWAAYEDLIEEYNPDVVIIDSLLQMADGDLNNSQDMKIATKWLRRIRRKYRCGIILIHHNRKANAANKSPNKLDDIFGSQILNKDIDSAFVLFQEEGSSQIQLHNVKSRYSPKFPALDLTRNDNLVFSTQNTTSEQQLALDLRNTTGTTGLSLDFTPVR